jgi:nucleoside-diphosphate-sugar epimerase
MRVLLTGAESFTGSHILAQLLCHDTVSVRAVVKSAEAARTLREQHRWSHPYSLDFVTVLGRNPMTPGIFDDALHELAEPFHAVVHTIDAGLYDEADCLARFIQIGTDATVAFLKSIQGIARVVRRVVIVTSLIPFARWLRDPRACGVSDRNAVSERSSSSSVGHEYTLATSQASSNIVSDAVLSWIKQSDARFDVVFVTAPSVYGPTPYPLENSSDLTKANRRIWNICSNEHPDLAQSPLYGIDHFADVRVRHSTGFWGLSSVNFLHRTSLMPQFVHSSSRKPQISASSYQLGSCLQDPRSPNFLWPDFLSYKAVSQWIDLHRGIPYAKDHLLTSSIHIS